MSNTEDDSLVFRLEQLEQQQQVLARYMAKMKRELDSLSEQLSHQSEPEQLHSLQDVLTHQHQQFYEREALLSASVEVVNEPTAKMSGSDEIQQLPIHVQSYKYQLVFDRSKSRAVLVEALLAAQERLIIVCPWLNRNSIDADLMLKFRECLSRNCRIDIGWGYLSDRSRIGKGWWYDALKDLQQLERDYPNQFRLKLLGTHEKFLVCDATFAMLGSHNLLTSNVQSAEREVGIRTTDLHIIQGLINRFDGAHIRDLQTLDESLTTSDAIFDDETNEALDESKQDVREAVADVEEFLRRYDNKEREFIGINLARVDLTSRNLVGVCMIEANFYSAKLAKANLSNANLLQVNLSQANLSEANLGDAKLIAANLTGANLIKANLRGADLTAADLSQAKLTNAELYLTNLSGSTMTGVNFVGVNLQNVKLNGANLSRANLCGANLSLNKNLRGANLTNADLRGANLTGANLEKVKFTGANLGGANLNEANLSGAIMPDGSIHE